MVCRTAESATQTLEGITGGAIPFVDVFTTWTRLGGIGGIDDNHRNSGFLCLVLYKTSELREAPAKSSGTL